MSLRSAAAFSLPILLALVPTTTHAEGPSPGYHPWANEHVGPMELEVSELLAHPERYRSGPVQQPADVGSLDDFQAAPGEETVPDLSKKGATPEGWVQRGGIVLPTPVANGDLEVDPDVARGMQVVPGNEYPRKHTLYINFGGIMLYSGADNSAEDRSTLARQAVYPVYEGGEQRALSIIQNVQEDVASYGINVVYLERPNKTVPYTMEMVGGSWTDTNIDSPAGGVAPGADCGALGQRHVVYTFASGGTSATQAANTASQEAGHAWGLDHTFNCGSVMSYCGSSNGVFSTTCDGLCETQCQGPNSAGCRLTHEDFCGVGADQQNEDAELTWIFGGNEPDMEPPTVEIVSPENGAELDVGSDIDIRSLISDNYGGYGWYYYITNNGEVIVDQVDYDRQVDNDYRPALNLGGLTEGEWVITVGAEDHFGHITEDSVTIFVGVPNDTGLDDTAGEDGLDSEGGDANDTDEPEGTGETLPGADDDGGAGRGCACTATSSVPSGGLVGFVFLGLLGLRRRR